jgi:2-polyprenyl-3-methyl-5-hydroxy-6-metoxy-1,4-benzoquinol methylase
LVLFSKIILKSQVLLFDASKIYQITQNHQINLKQKNNFIKQMPIPEKYKLTERSYQAELMDDLSLKGDDLRQNLDELAFINYWLGGNLVITKALQKLKKRGVLTSNKVIRIADLGSGGGDNLQVMAKWFRRQGIAAKLTGIDANDFMIEYAQKKTDSYEEINYQKRDVFSDDFKASEFDIVTMSLFCHHFTDTQLVRLFQKLYQETNKVVIINDLHRHPLAYQSIKFLTKALNGSHLVQNDAPLSVQRAFHYNDFANLLCLAGVSDFQIEWIWAFRFQVMFGKEI